MDSPTKANVLKFIDFQISKGLVNVNTGNARKAACNKLLEALGNDDDLTNVDVRSEVLKFNNRHPGQLSPDSLGTYEKRVTSTLNEFKKYREDPTGYKGVTGRQTSTNGKTDKKAKSSDATEITVIDMPPAAPKQMPTSAVTDTSLMMPFPLRPTFLAQLIIPRDLTKDEAARLCAFIQALAVEA